MTPRTIKLNAHRTLTYYTPEDVERIIAERDEARAVLASGHMQRILRYVFNHAGKGLNGSLQDSAAWIEKQIAATQNVSPNRSDQQQHRTTL